MSASEPARTRAAGELDAEALAQRIAEVAADRKAIDVRVLDVREIVSYTDFLVVCTGNTDRQTRAIQEAIRTALKAEHGLLPHRVDGETEASWILMDYIDCVCHVFTPDAREFYRLEQLWGEAPSRAVE